MKNTLLLLTLLTLFTSLSAQNRAVPILMLPTAASPLADSDVIPIVTFPGGIATYSQTTIAQIDSTLAGGAGGAMPSQSIYNINSLDTFNAVNGILNTSFDLVHNDTTNLTVPGVGFTASDSFGTQAFIAVNRSGLCGADTTLGVVLGVKGHCGSTNGYSIQVMDLHDYQCFNSYGANSTAFLEIAGNYELLADDTGNEVMLQTGQPGEYNLETSHHGDTAIVTMFPQESTETVYDTTGIGEKIITADNNIIASFPPHNLDNPYYASGIETSVGFTDDSSTALWLIGRGHVSAWPSDSLPADSGKPGDILTISSIDVTQNPVVKNLTWKPLTVPSDSIEPGTPATGQLFLNTGTMKMEFWNGAAWAVITSAP